ncbi:MAG: putative salt-induced outer membrane protein YdiY [Francisella sp.]|jgi:putative salt-induced outer membrane protein YdiY
MFIVNKKIIILFAGVCFLNNNFATTIPINKEQNIEYQKEADKYKELYEKYQKLANEASSEKMEDKSTDKKLVKSTEKSSEEIPLASPVEEKKDSKAPEVVAEPWKGTDFGFGGTIATGDSATTNVNALANVSYQPMDEWKNKLFFNYVYSTNDQGKTRAVKINKSQVRAETSWNFTKVNAAYGRLTYLNDELSTYDFIFTESVGYKRRVYENEGKTMYVELSAGPSFLQSRVTNGQLEVNKPGFQSTFDYVWNFADKSNFKQNILYNYDQKNKSIYQGISALSVELYKNFSLQLTFQLNGTTLVTPGKNNINTITSTNIMYTL